jgi:hypothetical protein
VFVRARQLEDLESCVDVLARVHAASPNMIASWALRLPCLL